MIIIKNNNYFNNFKPSKQKQYNNYINNKIVSFYIILLYVQYIYIYLY